MVDSKEVNAALERILATPAFVRSPRLAHFLRFAVEQRLAGRADSPKEFEVGVQVFGRRQRIMIAALTRWFGSRRACCASNCTNITKPSASTILFESNCPRAAYLASFFGGAVSERAPLGHWIPRRPIQFPLFRLRMAIRRSGASRLGNAPGFAGRLERSDRKSLGRHAPRSSKIRPIARCAVVSGRPILLEQTHPEDLHKAEDYFTQAIVADPGYAKGYVGLADCYGLMREFAGMPDSEAWPRALAASRKAVELDDSLAEAHSSLGFDLFYGSLDVHGGEREFKRALELNANYAQVHQWYANALTSLGRLQEASAEMEQARELEPGSRSILADQSFLFFYQGKIGEALDQLHQIEAAEPAFRSAHLYLAYIYFVARDCRNYLSESRKSAESSRDPMELAVVAEAEQGFNAGGPQGMLQSLLQAQKKFADDGRYPAFQVAETFAMLGRKRDALDYLDASYRKRELYLVSLNVAPTLASLRRETDYQEMLLHLGLDVPN